jgi:hypothetical protein
MMLPSASRTFAAAVVVGLSLVASIAFAPSKETTSGAPETVTAPPQNEAHEDDVHARSVRHGTRFDLTGSPQRDDDQTLSTIKSVGPLPAGPVQSAGPLKSVGPVWTLGPLKTAGPNPVGGPLVDANDVQGSHP